MSPELPYLAAGTLSLIAHTKAAGHLPSTALKTATATVVLVIVASATSGSKLGPLMHAIGLLLLMGAVFQFGKAFNFSFPTTPKKA